MIFNSFHIEIEFISDILGSTPKSVDVFKDFLVSRHNELAQKYAKANSKNVTIAKYSGQGQMDVDSELDKIFKTIEAELGRKLTGSEREQLLSDNSEDFILELLGESADNKAQVFLKDSNGLPYLSSHTVKGFLKSAAEAISRTRPVKAGKYNHSYAASSKYVNTMMLASDVFFFKGDGKREDIKRDGDGNPSMLSRPLRAKTAQGDRVALASSEVVSAGTRARFVVCVFGGDKAPVTQRDLEDAFEYGVLQGFGSWRGSGSYGRFIVRSLTPIESKSEAPGLDLHSLPMLK